MHDISYRPERAERGADPSGRSPLEGLVAARSAHLVVDLQQGFLMPGAPVEVPEARQIIANVNAISAAMRSAGGRNVFLRMNLAPTCATAWPDYYDRIPTAKARAELVAAFSPGSESFELWEDLEVQDGDRVLDKHRFSAFLPGASHLHDELVDDGVDTLVVTGTLTNVCCESTARDASQMGYRVLFVADATAALSDEAHNATLANIDAHFGRVVLTSEVLAALSPASVAPAANG
jgi:ureidoacrylate peracid hydrolase